MFKACICSPEILTPIGYLCVQQSLDLQAGFCLRGADQFNNRLKADQRLASPIHADEGKHPVLDPVPLARARWIVANGDGYYDAVRQLLQARFPSRKSSRLVVVIGGEIPPEVFPEGAGHEWRTTEKEESYGCASR